MEKRKALAFYLNLSGEVFIIFSILILFFTYGPVAKEEVSYQARQVLGVAKSEEELEPVNREFSIVIPKLSVSAPVFASVNPFNEKEYLPILQKGVAHAKGSALPGRFGNTYLFAHSTDAFYNVGKYNAVFYLLGKLEKGDQIYIYYNNEKYTYKVTDKKVVAPADVSYLGKSGRGNTLTLQTCYPPGTTLKRLVVVAEMEGEVSFDSRL